MNFGGKMITFYEWVIKRNVTDNPRGDFVTDTRHDERTAQLSNSREAWEAYLFAVGACSEARKVFDKLWRDYKRIPEVRGWP
jgi:uncharacterized protein YozE (UPF0346 family)